MHYRAPNSAGSYAWFLLDDPAESSLPFPDVASVTGAIAKAAASGYLCDPRTAVQAYASRRGIALVPDEAAPLLHVSDGTVTAELDQAGRISRLSGSAGPGPR